MKKNFTPIHKHSESAHHAVQEKHGSKLKKPQNTTALFILGFVLSLFISLNIAASQNSVPDLYFSFVTENPQAVTETLERTQRLKEYPEILAMQREIYGPTIDEHISSETNSRNEKIKYLESILQNNPESRDILYTLSILYRQNNQDSLSEQYLNRAKAVDPWIK